MTCNNSSIWLSLTYLEWAALARSGFIRVQRHRIVPVSLPVDISDFQQVMAAAPSLGLDSGGYVVAVLKSPLLERWSGDCAGREVLDVSRIDRFIVMDDVSKRMLVNGQEEFNGFRYETLADGVWSSWVDAEKKRLADYKASLGLRLFGFDGYEGEIFSFSMFGKDKLKGKVGRYYGGWSFALSEQKVDLGDDRIAFLSAFITKDMAGGDEVIIKGARFFGDYGRSFVRCLDDSLFDGFNCNALISRALFNHYVSMVNRCASDLDVSALRDDVFFLAGRSEFEARRFLASLFSNIDDEVFGTIRRGVERIPIFPLDQAGIGSEVATSIVEVGDEKAPHHVDESIADSVSTLKPVHQSAGKQEASSPVAKTTPPRNPLSRKKSKESDAKSPPRKRKGTQAAQETQEVQEVQGVQEAQEAQEAQQAQEAQEAPEVVQTILSLKVDSSDT